MNLIFPKFQTALALLLVSCSLAAAAPTSARVTESFDANWRFLKSDAPGAEQPAFDDANWRGLNVPHDWSIEGPFDQNNPAGGAGAWLPAGVGFYRKNFTLPQSARGQRVFIEFDGVMANSEVWINGFSLGKRPFGYASFRYELTDHLLFGAKSNLLAVRADNAAQPASRWYAGAGIYRHVRLVMENPLHLEHWGTFVSTPQVSAKSATVSVKSAVINQSSAPRDVSLQISLISPAGRTVATTTTKSQRVEAGKTADFAAEIRVSNPQLWDIDAPQIYRVVTRVRSRGATLDDETTPIGIRDAHFEAATGFWLNGRNLKIKGVCLHQDAGALGVAVPIGAWERRLRALKAIGVNAIRTAHNPPAPEFLDLCDRMGFLVMDELFDMWIGAKNPFDYHLNFPQWSLIDVRDTVRRDRNHPSVILYSAGNEIRDTPQAETAKATLSSLVAAFHQSDPTRPVTQALFRPNVSHDYDNGLADLLDVVGQNYRETELLAAHAQKPTRVIIGTENGHDRAVWLALRDNPAYSGQFLWAGVDYLGEARAWPDIASPFGLIDRTATARPLAYQRQSWWSDAPMIYMARRVARTRVLATDPGYETAAQERNPQVVFGDWTPRNLEPHAENVEVYSNCQSVELFLNDRSLGAKPRPADDSPRGWTAPFAPGILRAIAKNGGRIVAVRELRTAGPPAKIVLSSDRARLSPDFDDVAYVSASVVDANGTLIPGASDLISFQVSGAGAIAAVDNGDNSSHEAFQASERHAYQGRCVAIVRATGEKAPMVLTASAPGLTGAKLEIATEPRLSGSASE